ncbi:MAG TPA: proline--tRNA ligase [Candidatus Saccharimonadales bacterium]|nr:proline--tRNA ligase [Candidatus Saccharimonadales bacterium]
MRVSHLFGRTSKTEGVDYKIPSHRLLTQGGFIRESTAGRYYMLPLGLKIHDKIIEVVRKHMDAAGAQEVVMPVLHPLELWKETNRTTTTGFELMKITDRRGADFALGGTAEEMAVDLVRKFNVSYKDLPFNIYQFSMKFRDEMRARGGLLRVREFVMKDAYSFSTEEQFKAIYQQMWDAYKTIFEELGLKVDVVAADNGYIGGEYCHEFVVESKQGESRYFIDETSGYAAHEDVATFKVEDKNVDEALRDMQEVDAERGKTMEDGVTFHDLPLWQQTKDVLFFDEATKRYILAIIRGDFDVNETKLMQAANAWDLRPATDEEIRDDLGSEPGFISPVDFPKKGTKSGYTVTIVGDKSLRTVRNMYGGANKKHRDILNMNIDRDYKPDIEADIALAQPGMVSPDGGRLVEKRGIEVGNIFQLGYHYTNLMQGTEYTDISGKRQKYYMGSYGIGIGRTMAAIVEAHHDGKGIIWPAHIAPFAVYLARLGESEAVVQAADKLYEDLTAAGVLVLYDDRTDARAGEKFADADLIGLPYRVVVSEKTIASQQFEVKKRTEQDTQLLGDDDVIKLISQNDAGLL